LTVLITLVLEKVKSADVMIIVRRELTTVCAGLRAVYILRVVPPSAMPPATSRMPHGTWHVGHVKPEAIEAIGHPATS